MRSESEIYLRAQNLAQTERMLQPSNLKTRLGSELDALLWVLNGDVEL
jgi:hypothetical protein